MARHVCAGPSSNKVQGLHPSCACRSAKPSFCAYEFHIGVTLPCRNIGMGPYIYPPPQKDLPHLVVTLEDDKVAVVPAKSTKEARLIAAELAVKKKKKP